MVIPLYPLARIQSLGGKGSTKQRNQKNTTTSCQRTVNCWESSWTPCLRTSFMMPAASFYGTWENLLLRSVRSKTQLFEWIMTNETSDIIRLTVFLLATRWTQSPKIWDEECQVFHVITNICQGHRRLNFWCLKMNPIRPSLKNVSMELLVRGKKKVDYIQIRQHPLAQIFRKECNLQIIPETRYIWSVNFATDSQEQLLKPANGMAIVLQHWMKQRS